MNTRLVLRTACALIGLLSVDTRVAARQGTDFSGHWVLESKQQAGADTPVAITVEQSFVSSDARREPAAPLFNEITVAREFRSGTRSETFRIGLGGGTVPGISVEHGRSSDPYTHFSVGWDGPVLVFRTGTHTGMMRETGDWAEHEERWSLDSEGRLRVVIANRSSSSVLTTTTGLYRRREDNPYQH